MKVRNWRRAGLPALATIGLLGLGFGTFAAPTLAATGPVYGGTVVEALSPQLNINWYLPLEPAAMATAINNSLWPNLYIPLLYLTSSYAIDYQASIASRVAYNRAGTVFHVFMNPKWHWSDGEPVTSKDVLFTWELIQATSSPKAPAPWPWVFAGSGDVPTGVKSVVANGPYEFTVTLKTPVNQEWFIYNGLSNFTPLPAQAWNRYPNNPTEEVKWLGAQGASPKIDSVIDGPFRVAGAIQNQSWTLVPNPKYSGRRPYLSKVVFAYQGSDAAEFAALKTGQVQLGYLPLGEYGARAELPDRLASGFTLGYQSIWPNLNSQAPNGSATILGQSYVRQAMEMAINQPQMVNLIFHGVGEPVYGPVPAKPKTVFHSAETTNPIYPYDPARAKALLKAHGWHMVNGVMTKGSQKMAFTMLEAGGSIASGEEAEYIQQEWQAIGIKITLRPEPANTEIGVMSTPKGWQLAYGIGVFYGSDYPFTHTLFGTGGSLNFMGWNNATENRLIAAVHEPWPTTQESLAHLYAYENDTARSLPVLWVPMEGAITAYAPTLHAPAVNLADNLLIQNWWVGP